MAFSLGRLLRLGGLPEPLRNEIDLALFYTRNYIFAALNALRRGESMEDLRKADSFSEEAKTFARRARELIVQSLHDPEAMERLEALASIARKGVLFNALRRKTQTQLQGLGSDVEWFAVSENIELAREKVKEAEDPKTSQEFKDMALTKAIELLRKAQEMTDDPTLLYSVRALLDKVGKQRSALRKYEAPLTHEQIVEAKAKAVEALFRNLDASVRLWSEGKPIISFLKFRGMLPSLVKTQREKLRQEGFTEEEIAELTLGPTEIVRLREPDTIRVGDEVRTRPAPFSLKQALQRFPFSTLETRRSVLEKLYNASGVLSLNLMQETITRRIAELEEMDPGRARELKLRAELMTEAIENLKSSRMPEMPRGLGLLLMCLNG